MSLLMKDIEYLNTHLLQENERLKLEIKRLNDQLDYDSELIQQQGKRIVRLEAELSELRGMQQQSKVHDSSRNIAPGMASTL